MSLSSGDRLGHYVISEPLGAGGMGEVFRATDSRLGREVAIKVLPEAVAADPDRLTRFEREAKVLASLNHPNIATLFGLESVSGADVDAGTGPQGSSPTTFLAMELVEGQDLAQLIANGPIPLKEAIAFAHQIAEGLEAAHAEGIVHRDLKPANIRITLDGTVKILDFGLAKAWHAEPSDADYTESPTISAEMTRDGTILGTAPYMSPEQALGKVVDRRTDIWAFGCVLYEMLTGRRAFAGGSSTEIIVQILEREPGWDALPPSVSPALRLLLGRCLEKDARDRLRDAGDVGLAIEDLNRGDPDFAQTQRPRSIRPLKIALALVSTAAVVLAVLSWTWRSPATNPEPAATMRFTEPSPAALDIAKIGHFGSAVAISPDGHVLVWVGFTGESTQLFSRHLDEVEARPIPGTEGAVAPFFSPDGEWIAFLANAKLQKVAVRGGAPQTISQVDHIHGASWGDGFILLESTGAGTLAVVDPAGGPLGPLNSPGLFSRVGYPKLLPGSRTALANSLDGNQVILISLDSGEVTPLINDGSNASYVPSGHLVWTSGDNLLAAPFDIEKLEITGNAHTVVEGVLSEPTLVAHYAVSNEGTLVYLPGTAEGGGNQPVWVKFDGTIERLPLPAEASHLSPRISPDGRMVLITRPGESCDIWSLEIDRGIASPISDSEGTHYWSVWTPDSKGFIFNWMVDGHLGLWTQPTDRSTPPRRLTNAPPGTFHVPLEITRDGRTVLLEVAESPPNAFDFHVLDLEGEPKIEELLVTDTDVFQPHLSPDDRWLAYSSDVTGRLEVYVQPFPDLGATVRASPNGGQEPIWSFTGDRLYYRSINGRRIFAVEVQGHDPLRFGDEELVVEGPFMPGIPWGRKWDLHPDGDKFLALRIENKDSPTGIQVVRNWFAELERLVPTTRP